MYAIAFWSAELAAFVIIAVGFVVLARRNEVALADIGLFIAPFVLWWGLLFTGLRPKSLSNLVELFALVPLLAVIFAVRTFARTGVTPEKKAMIAFASGLAVSAVLYLFVPLLPE